MDRAHVVSIASLLGIVVPTDWQGLDAVWPLLEKMRKEGAIVLVKLDGERVGPDARPYTALASGAPLGEGSVRTDAATVEEALSHVISRYASKVWGIPLPP